MNERYIKYAALVVLALASTAVLAAGGDATTASTGAIDGAMKNFEAASMKINAKLVTLALETAVAALSLQWILTYFKEIFSGDMTSSLAKAVGLVTWFGGSLYAIQHVDILSNAYVGYLKLAGSLSDLDAKSFTPSGVFDSGAGLIKAVNKALLTTVGNNWFAFSDNFLAALTSVVVSLVLLITFFIISLSLFVTNLEFWMLFAVAPLAFALIPLSTFRDQGMAPLKGAISLGLRILILGVIVSVAKQMTDTAVTALSSYTLPEGESAFSSLSTLLAGLFGCALMALQAGKIASAIASGSASFSGSDAIKGGMAMAGAAGVATAATAALGGSALGTIKAVANPAGKTTGHAMNALSAAKDFFGGGKMGVSPVGGGSGAGGASTPGANFGGPAIEPRPSPGSDASSGSKSSSSGAGDAGTASIGGAGPNSPATQSGGSSALQKLGSATRGAGDALGQDNATVGVQMHVGKD
jgi:type IV secretion system protein TrbL